MAALPLQNQISIHPSSVVAADTDLRGIITIGPQCVLHPKCTILSPKGPLIIGRGNIFEENTVLINRSVTPMRIGDWNLFEVGARIESPVIGNHNTFEPKSRTTSLVSIGSNCCISAGVILLPQITTEASSPTPLPSSSSSEASEGESEGGGMEVQVQKKEQKVEEEAEMLPDFTSVFGFGPDVVRRRWTGEGEGQARALHVKHLEYLRETLPKFNKVRPTDGAKTPVAR
ncbi:hypothetical protein BT69DRAFT_1330960 [Atractiella rhizophila]|nr:hypothetical protein BT69DRAFT_1330960 [Atractiella rhizophila]